MHTVQFVHTGDECNTVKAEDGQTILSVADENGINTRRGCNNGCCRLCVMRIRHGLENIVNKRSQQPFTNQDRVPSCIAEIHGNITVETQSLTSTTK